MKRSLYFLSFFLLLASCNQDPNSTFLRDGKVYPYYNSAFNYQGGFYAVKAHFFNKYKSVNTKDNSGIVRIQFKINCTGEIGDIKHKVYSLNYENGSINPAITNQLLKLTKELTGWITNQKDGEGINIHKFYAFRIEAGELVDILPK